jgi:integrase
MAIRAAKDASGNPIQDLWEVDVYARRRPDGSRPRIKRRVHGGIRTAEKVERDLKTARDAGRLSGPTSTLKHFLSDYFDGREGDVSPVTLDGYRRYARTHITPRIGALKLSDVDPQTVRRLYRDMQKAGLSGTTRLGTHRVLSMAMKRAKVDGLIMVNPMDAVKAPQASTEEVQALTGEEVQRLLGGLEGTGMYLPALLAVTTGLRRGEVLALMWEDVDLQAGVLNVRATVQQVGSTIYRKAPKTKRSTRAIKLSESVVAKLSQHAEMLAEARARMGHHWHEEGYVFPSLDARKEWPAGRVWSPSAFAQSWRRAMKDANGRFLGEHVAAGESVETFEPWSVHFHTLRHTAATLWLSRGARDELVSRVLGHSSSRVTKAVYSHLLGDEQALTVSIMDDVLGEQAGE